MIYFDYNATTPLDKRVFTKMRLYLTREYANPSAIYRLGQRSRRAIERARAEVAHLLGALPEEIVFTSGGTEAINAAIKGVVYSRAGGTGHIIASRIEHSAVLKPCQSFAARGMNVTYLDVDTYGQINCAQLEKNIRKETILVSLMYANNEVGTIQPIREIASICAKRGIILHVDAVQAVGKIQMNVKELGADLLSLSGHKFYGPKGAGALYVRKGITLTPLLEGGHQEADRRGGTEHVVGIVGLGHAAYLARQEMGKHERSIKMLRDTLQEQILTKISGVKVNGHPQDRLYNTLHILIEGVSSETLVINLDFKNICVSGGAACISGAQGASHVLLAMGIPESEAKSALRISLGKYNTQADIERMIKVLPPLVEKLRKMAA
ncbi:MAG: cysteine desulfurase family protein [Candidatus Omnitrophota bacterium]|nr:cysteine desulfurase [Candidatus Omnitrophota bacterium]